MQLRGEFFVSKVKCVHWPGACKIVDNEYYVTEGLHHNTTMHGPGMSGTDLEWIFMNWFYVMNLNIKYVFYRFKRILFSIFLISEGCCRTENFLTFCVRLKFIMLLRKCVYDTFGVKRMQSSWSLCHRRQALRS